MFSLINSCPCTALIHSFIKFVNFLQLDNQLDSILASSRKIDTLVISYTTLDEEELTKFIAIAKKFGSTVRELRLSCCFSERPSPYVVNSKLLGEFFENLPNLLEWKLDYTGYGMVHFQGLGQHELKLESLSLPLDPIKAYSDESEDNLNHKFASFVASGTLKRLEIYGGMVNFKDFIRRQTALKSIRITAEYY